MVLHVLTPVYSLSPPLCLLWKSGHGVNTVGPMRRRARNKPVRARHGRAKRLPGLQFQVCTRSLRTVTHAQLHTVVDAATAGDKRPSQDPAPAQPRPSKKPRCAGEALQPFRLTSVLVDKQTRNLDTEVDIGELSELSEPE